MADGAGVDGVSGSERDTIDEELTLDPKIQAEVTQILDKIYRGDFSRYYQ